MFGLVVSLPNKEDLHATSRNHEIEEAAKQDDFLFKQSKDEKQRAVKLVKGFLDASPQRHVNASCFTHEILKQVFEKISTAIPSSAAVERVFRLEKTF